MTTRDDVLAALDDYVAGAVAAQKATDQVTISSITAQLASESQLVDVLNGKLAADDATIAQLQAQIAALSPATTIKLSDFAQSNSGLLVATGSLVPGTDPTKTVYELPANTSTKTSPTTGTATYRLMRAGGQSSTKAATVELGGFTLQGTDQGALMYGGLQLGYGTGSKVHDMIVTGIPGSAAGPSTGIESFSLEVWRADSSALARIKLDGRRASDGKQVAATMLGYSSASGTSTCDDLVANYALYGFGLALWQCTGTQTFNNADLRFNRKAVNIEQSLASEVNLNACNFKGTTGAGYVAQVSTTNQKRTVVNFRDPVVDAWPLKVRTFAASANNGTNGMLDSDVHLYIGGKDVTGDTTKLQIVHSG